MRGPAAISWPGEKTSSLLTALAPGATIVFLADEFVEPDFFPFGMKLHFEIFGPWGGENVRIIHRESKFKKGVKGGISMIVGDDARIQ